MTFQSLPVSTNKPFNLLLSAASIANDDGYKDIVDHSHFLRSGLLSLCLMWLRCAGCGFRCGSFRCDRFGGSQLGIDMEKDNESDVDETHDEYSFGLDLESTALLGEVLQIS